MNSLALSFSYFVLDVDSIWRQQSQGHQINVFLFAQCLQFNYESRMMIMMMMMRRSVEQPNKSDYEIRTTDCREVLE